MITNGLQSYQILEPLEILVLEIHSQIFHNHKFPTICKSKLFPMTKEIPPFHHSSSIRSGGTCGHKNTVVLILNLNITKLRVCECSATMIASLMLMKKFANHNIITRYQFFFFPDYRLPTRPRTEHISPLLNIIITYC